MIKVTIADVVQGEHKGHQVCGVILLDEVGHRLLPIWVGKWESESIARGLRKHSHSRPLTFDFMANLLEAMGASLESIRIEAIREGRFHAVAQLKSGDRVREVDARPSDAIALALRLNSSIYVAEEVLEQAKLNVPVKELEPRQLGKGVENIMRELESQQMRKEQKRQALSSLTQKEKEEGYQKLIAVMSGSRNFA
ncbi:MAG: bifunctional nuclease family protein [Chroococcidiopsidaceae cyanobacterium CP_BM_RX_35]|nr:bifunctional nuclease family protein [Chroococcidiopsidaceae cyanobacterium CP_BM_RX_35]